MSAVILVGTQWGDEGKGKVTDYLACEAEVVVRYQGGNNAGHTVVVDDREFKLHLVPSGVLYPDKLCVIGNGVALNIETLAAELDYLEQQGIDIGNLRISERAHLVFPYHRLMDELEEDNRGELRLGTTRRGIGPAYMDKSARMGIRVIDLFDPPYFTERLRVVLEQKNRILSSLYGCEPIDADSYVGVWLEMAERIRPFVADTTVLIDQAIAQGKHVLFEGAQGTLLDLDFGTYPFVTSSHPIAGGACIGAGVGPTRIDRVIGVAKAYTSRVGDGPFPTEDTGSTGEWIRNKGNEYGTSTGRPRRCGWLDFVILRFAGRVSGLDALAVTRLDVLTGLDSIKVCTHYRCDGREIREFPADLRMLARCEPVYETFPGWSEDFVGAESLDDLPLNARRYVEAIEDLSGIPVALISIGRERQQTIRLRPVFGGA